MEERFLIAGPYRLDLRNQRLWTGEQSVPLGGRAFALLAALMENSQLLLTKDELLDRAWPGVTVSESVLTTAVKELRRALADDARSPRVIETVHGRGYRFMLPVERSDEAEASAAPPPAAASAARRPRRLMIGGLSLAFAAAVLLFFWITTGREAAPPTVAQNPKSVAVLPFEDLSPAGEGHWFAAGLTEEVVNSLSRTPDLQVASRAATRQSGLTSDNVAALGRQLGVVHLLEGSVRREGGRVRVRAELIRAADGINLWSQNYDVPSRDAISIQEDIAFRIASSLKTVLDPKRLRSMVEAGTRSVEAYEAYLTGLSYDQRQFDEGSLDLARRAADAYERARQLDPQFAAAHWRAAQTWFGNATRLDSAVRGSVGEDERLRRYLERVDAAARSSKDDVERLRYSAAAAVVRLQLRQAHRMLVAYVSQRPRDIEAWDELASASAYAGERAWIARAAERVHELSVAEGAPRSRAITLSVMAARIPEAAARAEAHLRLRPDAATTQYQSHRAFLWAGRRDEAARLLRQLQASSLPQDNKLLAALRQACAEGRRGDAVNLARRLDEYGDLGDRWQAAQLLGDEQAAVALLQPLDVPESLPTLIQYMIHPTFDARRFPRLHEKLVQNGITPHRPIKLPFACASAPRGPARLALLSRGGRAAAPPPTPARPAR